MTPQTTWASLEYIMYLPNGEVVDQKMGRPSEQRQSNATIPTWVSRDPEILKCLFRIPTVYEVSRTLMRLRLDLDNYFDAKWNNEISDYLRDKIWFWAWIWLRYGLECSVIPSEPFAYT